MFIGEKLQSEKELEDRFKNTVVDLNKLPDFDIQQKVSLAISFSAFLFETEKMNKNKSDDIQK